MRAGTAPIRAMSFAPSSAACTQLFHAAVVFTMSSNHYAATYSHPLQVGRCLALIRAAAVLIGNIFPTSGTRASALGSTLSVSGAVSGPCRLVDSSPIPSAAARCMATLKFARVRAIICHRPSAA